MHKPEMTDITICKGFAITLVVLGHIAGHSIPDGHGWYEEFRRYLYLFHMPFFMFLSGYVYFRPGRLKELSGRYASYFRSQFVKLMVPFFAFGFGILALKLNLPHEIHVDNVPSGWADGLAKILWNTNDSPVLFVWYIFALFVFTVGCPLLYPVLKERMDFWLIFGLVVYAMPWIDVLYANKLAAYFVFFVFGGLLRHNVREYFSMHNAGYLCAFVLALVLLGHVDKKIAMLVVGALSIPALHFLCRTVFSSNGLFYALGKESYVIYLFNTLFIGAMKAAVFLFADWDGMNFLWVGPLLVFAGLFGPVIAKRMLFGLSYKLLHLHKKTRQRVERVAG